MMVKKIGILFFIITLIGVDVFFSGDKCYFDGEICRKSVQYEDKPINDLYRKDGQDIKVIQPIDAKKAFFIDSVQLGDDLYIAFQNYDGSLVCKKEDYIDSINVKYVMRFYIIKKGGRGEALKAIDVKPIASLNDWVSQLKVDQSIRLACIDGEVDYSYYKTDF